MKIMRCLILKKKILIPFLFLNLLYFCQNDYIHVYSEVKHSFSQNILPFFFSVYAILKRIYIDRI